MVRTVMLLAVLYVLFSGQLSSTELVAGASCIAATLGWQRQVGRSRERQLRVHARWMKVAGSTLRSLAVDSWAVGVVLVKTLRPGPAATGRIERHPCDCGATTPDDRGGRALTTTTLSLAPNSFVIRLCDEANPAAYTAHRLACR